MQIAISVSRDFVDGIDAENGFRFVFRGELLDQQIFPGVESDPADIMLFGHRMFRFPDANRYGAAVSFNDISSGR